MQRCQARPEDVPSVRAKHNLCWRVSARRLPLYRLAKVKFHVSPNVHKASRVNLGVVLLVLLQLVLQHLQLLLPLLHLRLLKLQQLCLMLLL